jgi:L-threonylcarbamoyladenylate synthase
MVKIDIYLSLEDIILKILNKENIKEASVILKNNGILAFPTETVYGLGVVAPNLENYNHLISVKKRPPEKPFTLMASNIKQVETYIEFNEISKKIIDKFMPGPLTLILKAKENIPYCVDHGTGFVGIRIPDDKFVLNLIDTVNEPLFVPSCNKSGEKPCMNTGEVIRDFNGEIDGVIDGSCENGIPSTIIKVDGKNIILIRQGKLSLEEIKEKIK